MHREALAVAPLPPVRMRTARRELADGARVRLAASIAMAHPLADVARSLNASPFHLAHVFREEVGQSLHQYLVRLRLVAALDHLAAGATDLSMLALELGFSNHSHFSVTFRRTFGVSPSEARRRLTAASLPEEGQVRRTACAQ
jgi:Transcriptional regulator containing an amidase domain and an AraC-type DNA-binding HTH domain